MLFAVLKRTRYDIPKEVLVTVIFCLVDALKTSAPVYASIRRIVYIAISLGMCPTSQTPQQFQYYISILDEQLTTSKECIRTFYHIFIIFINTLSPLTNFIFSIERFIMVFAPIMYRQMLKRHIVFSVGGKVFMFTKNLKN